ncbi:MAG: tetratricopeptide repeat protein [Rhodospirillales bacterium]|nr:tetratricopeptide repeat protein [Rhodospirillales bacterium]
MISASLPEDCRKALSAFGHEETPALSPAEIAIWAALPDHPGLSPGRYFHHLSELAAALAAAYEALQAAGHDDEPETQRLALKSAFIDDHGYDVDAAMPGDLQNYDLVRVIDRRRGSSGALALLSAHAARALGWDMSVLDMAGAFVLRLGQGLLFAPGDGCKILQAPDLRRLVKDRHGPAAELSATYYKPLSPHELLVSFFNTLKFRQIEEEDYEAALQTVSRMKLMAPDEYRLWLDEGVLAMRTGQPRLAQRALEAYIEQAPDPRDQHDARLLLQQVALMPDA